ncbi:hypothetical protein B566_EDAN005241 [Ephemera danica]|nr:hypothetical protein B566_EDAN005241 [Ephemera danica]
MLQGYLRMLRSSYKVPRDLLRPSRRETTNAERVTRTERVVPRTRRLHLRNVSVADNGVYRCAAHNEAGSVFSRENFALAVPGEGVAMVRTVPSTQLVRRGADARFDCSFEGAEVVEWYFSDVPVEGDLLPSPR